MPLNFEFKAKTNRLPELLALLQPFHPRFVGQDIQIDTYFAVPYGRLKLREGAVENALIHYRRDDVAGAKTSQVLLYQHHPEAALKEVLTAALPILTVVRKSRAIYFVENVKFHFDQVEGLGSFVEVEAIDKDGSLGIDKLQQQCHFYAQLFSIREEEYVAHSYSDLLS